MLKELMLGNEAIARGAYEAGVTVVSSYPGTPSTEITECIAKRYAEIYSEWASNEKVALEVAIGAAMAGARSMTAMKHVGLNVAADPLFTVSYTGINGGLLIVVADDPGMHSSQNEQDSRHYARAAKLPLLEPADSQECKDFVKKAYEISEEFDTPVMIRLSTRISHSLSPVELEERTDYELKDYQKDIGKNVMMPAMARKRHLIIEERMEDLKGFAEKSSLNQIFWGDKKIGVISSGIAYQYAREAFGGDVSYLKLGMVYPLPEKLIRDFAAEVDVLYVVEELEPFLEEQIKALGIEVTGKEFLPVTGELNSGIIQERLLGKEKDTEAVDREEVPGRPPVLCPGCPHRATFHILKKLKLNVVGDIGCYTLGALPPVSAMDICVCMGASIGIAHGMEKARGRDFAGKTVAVIGDSTFIHSGITGLIDIVYNKGTSTVIILDNSITGMTGHQENPTTGYTIKGEPTKQVNLVKLGEAIGIERIKIVDPFNLRELEEIIKEELAVDEPSLIIAQRPCALLKKANYTGYAIIDKDVCRNCKLCMSIACPAMVDKGDYIEIDDSLCNGCMLCAEKCPFDAIMKVGGNDE